MKFPRAAHDQTRKKLEPMKKAMIEVAKEKKECKKCKKGKDRTLHGVIVVKMCDKCYKAFVAQQARASHL